MRKRILTVVTLGVALGALGIGIVARREARHAPYRLEGSTDLPGSLAAARLVLIDLQRWVPWGDLPGAGVTAGGQAGRPGATCYVTAPVVKARLTVLEVGADALQLELEWSDPARHQADLELRLSPVAGGTRVAWALSGARAGIDFPFSEEGSARLGARLGERLATLDGAVREQAQSEASRVDRSVQVSAPPAAVLARLADLRGWSAWSPRETLDPLVVRRYGGAASGKGQSYYWSSGKGAGQGRLTIVGLAADTVELEQELVRPRPASSDIAVKVLPEGQGTRITWTVTGSQVEPAEEIDRRLAMLRAVVEAAGDGCRGEGEPWVSGPRSLRCQVQ
jgi:hypothetical protein